MKTFTRAALTGVGVSVILSVSCSKNESEGPNGKKNEDFPCDVAVFAQQYTNGETRYIFNKSYDLSGRRLNHIDAGLYSGGAILDTLHLNLTYDYNKIYFISSENSSDTGLVLHVDNAGRPLRADVGEIIDFGFGPQEFYYDNDRLVHINIDDNWLRIWFRYDQHGNNTQIVTDSSEGLARTNVVYQYNQHKKSLQQFYMDEARGFSFNVLTILHAAGFFPELNPVHERERTTVNWGNYVAYDFEQKDHSYDNSGRLLQYKTSAATYTVNYNCASNNNKLITAAR